MPNKQDIIEFFKIVCNGIRDEYEEGASYRDLKKDVKTLNNLLDNFQK